MEELVLEGRKYVGSFQVNQKHRVAQFSGDHYCDYEEDRQWYEGVGKIKEISLGNEQCVLLRTEETAKQNRSLKECFIPFNKEDMIDKPTIIDLLLEPIYQSARDKKSEEIIPSVTPPKFNFSELIERGLIPESSGQIRLAFA